jgi:DNA-binding NarL/FixJ family response regulator
MNAPSISVILIDHNPILLNGIAALIRSQADMQLVGMGRTARDAVALHLQYDPDFTVIDLDLPDDRVTYAIRQILSADPAAKLIGLTTCELDSVGPEARAAGVLGVVAKDRLEEDLVPLIRAHTTGKY